MDRPTSKWVPIDRLVVNPNNPNKMSDDDFEKLKRNIDDSDFMPPIIVRTLEVSQSFEEDRRADKLQIIDGEHRWRVAKERGDKEVEVRILSGVSDERATRFLLTLNDLRGKSDKAKRGRLIRDLYEIEPDADVLATILPESSKQISSVLEEITREAVKDATEKAKKVSEREPLTIFVMPKQGEIIRRAIKTAQAKIAKKVECEEGEALAMVSKAYLDGEG